MASTKTSPTKHSVAHVDSLTPLPDHPLVTVLVTNYNHAEFIEETILSILGQDYQHFELIIVDGGSTDGTLEILKRYDSDPRIRWISEPDEGTVDAYLKGIKLAKTGKELVLFFYIAPHFVHFY